MKKFGISLLVIVVAAASLMFSRYMTKNTEVDTLSVDAVYLMAQESGYTGTLDDFINEFRGAIGADGRGIADARVNGEGRLIITYTDNTSVDAGAVSVGNINLSEDSISGEALHAALTSSVSIYCSLGDGNYNVGSGILYKLDRENGSAYIITNHHVLYNKAASARVPDSAISVYFYGHEYEKFAVPATYVGGSSSYDIAVLKISDSSVLKQSSAAAVRLGDSERISVLDSVVAVGNPGGNGISATKGSVSIESENRYVNISASGGSVFMRVIRFDAAVNKGNSGGGLYDCRGELVGIVTAKDTASGSDGISYAIPINVASAIADNILHYCDGNSREQGYVLKLGISLDVIATDVKYDEISERTVRVETVAVSEITVGSRAEAAGLAVGDVIKSVMLCGKEISVTRVYQAPEVNLRAFSGDVIVYRVLRGGEEIEISFTVPDEISVIQ